jgi:phosphoribosylformylglycinamidine synthase subunit PurSL
MPLIHRIEIRPNLEKFRDAEGENLLKNIRQFGIRSVRDVHVIKIYKVEGIIDEEALNDITDNLLVERLWQEHSVDDISPQENEIVTIEIAKKPGVMDPEAQSIADMITGMGIEGLKAVATGKKYLLYGNPSEEELTLITDKLLMNKIIETRITEPEKTLLISQKPLPAQTIHIRGMSDDELLDLSKDRLWLNLDEMKIIRSFFSEKGREPTDVEIEVIAQTWSEHCYHKTFKADLTIDGKKKSPLFSRIKGATDKINSSDCISVFEDNSGVIAFDDTYAICGKVETHNSPSAIEPYGGAATGSGGVFRDIMGTGKGAKVLLSTDIFCFAPLDTPSEDIPSGCLHPKRLCQEVVRGVRDYGNRMGIPTANGSLHFHPDWRAKPTIIVGAYGIMPKEYAAKGEPEPGDVILSVGGKTGRDGLHGVTFSSGSMTPETETTASSAVQIGNAIEEKRMADALLVIRDRGYIRAITDCGGGGYSSAVGEMAEDTGCEIHLEKVPLKYQGLASWEIWISESQERMIAAIPPEHLSDVLKVLALYNVEGTPIGTFTDTGKLTIYHEGETVCDLPMDFLHNGLPRRHMTGTYKQREFSEPEIEAPIDLRPTLKKLLAFWDICSKEPIVRQYDHEVQGTSVLKPFGGIKADGPNDAVVLEPVLGSGKGMAVAHGMNPVYNIIDPYHGSASAIDEAVRNMVAVGADPGKITLLDNFIWPFPDEESLGDLDRSVDACHDTADAFNMPFVSGKDSLSSTYASNAETIKIPPTLCISAFAPVDDISKTVSADFKEAGSDIYIIGNTKEELGGSAYFRLKGCMGNKVPTVDHEIAMKIFYAVHDSIRRGLVSSCHDCSEGGIGVAIAEMCFGGDLGADIDIDTIPREKGLDRPDFIFFSESNSRFIMEVSQDNTSDFERSMKEVPHARIGSVTKNKKIRATMKGITFLSASLKPLKNAWKSTFEGYF